MTSSPSPVTDTIEPGQIDAFASYLDKEISFLSAMSAVSGGAAVWTVNSLFFYDPAKKPAVLSASSVHRVGGLDHGLGQDCGAGLCRRVCILPHAARPALDQAGSPRQKSRAPRASSRRDTQRLGPRRQQS
jgi:hypothetical protein